MTVSGLEGASHTKVTSSAAVCPTERFPGASVGAASAAVGVADCPSVASLVPTPFTARTRNVYSALLFKPVTM